MINYCYCIIYYKNSNTNQGRIIYYNSCLTETNRLFQILTTGSKEYLIRNKGLYNIIKYDKKYTEYLGVSMRDSDLNFISGEFNETILTSKFI